MRSISPRASFFVTIGMVTTVFPVLSLMGLLEHADAVGWTGVHERILEYYFLKRDQLFDLLGLSYVADLLVRSIESLLMFELTLSQHWSDLFLLLFFYLGARAKSYFSAGLIAQGLFRVVFGFLLSLTVGVGAGVVSSIEQADLWTALAIVTVGIAIFEIVDAGWSATFHRKSGFKWLADYTRYLGYSLPVIGISTIYLVVTLFVFPQPTALSTITLLLGYLLTLSCYWLYRGAQSAVTSPTSLSPVRSFLNSSNTNIGLWILFALLGLCWGLVTNAW